MKNALFKELLTGLTVVLIGVLYWLAALYQVDGIPDAYGISSRTLPSIVSSVLVLLGLLLAVEGYKRWRCSPTIAVEQAKVRVATRKGVRVLIYIGAIALYLLGIHYISFILSTGLMLLFSMLFCGQRNRIVLIVCTLLAPLCIYLVFAKIMMIPLPVTWLSY